MTTLILAARWWLAARRATRNAWRNGADLFTAAELAGLHYRRAACPICGGRHCAGCQAQLRPTGRAHTPAHDELSVPPSVPALLIADVAIRARAITAELGNRAWRPAGDPPRWMRRLQLELTARLRADGVAAALDGPRVVLP